ncbi:hypothetical protein BOTBODRAFT_67009 [Botryobasidium botryosum FD-172 SS1]|uniref:Uncharacterized protein n=1 Tax=Botryobasidium botryosum (strain FD-172 SS1) TaxID=930990 RepID=A0A067MB75_BOTB1|nr:hypothetical protein BOTBODRAFT_67009 [Botryobasidium botryosum FD-172 SS1]
MSRDTQPSLACRNIYSLGITGMLSMLPGLSCAIILCLEWCVEPPSSAAVLQRFSPTPES